MKSTIIANSVVNWNPLAFASRPVRIQKSFLPPISIGGLNAYRDSTECGPWQSGTIHNDPCFWPAMDLESSRSHTRQKPFLFASEIKGLLMSGRVAFQPQANAVTAYVALGSYPMQRRVTRLSKGCVSLPSGHWSLINPRHADTRRYWCIPDPEPACAAIPVMQLCDEYRHLFADSVRLCKRADVPIGTCLSGGLDSSSIVAMNLELMRQGGDLLSEQFQLHQKTFSAVYDTNGVWNERRHIDRVLQHTKAAAHFVYPTSDRLWREIEEVIWHQEEPFGSLSIFAQWCVMRLGRDNNAKVLLDGQGADEVLAGYNPFRAYLQTLVGSGRIPSAMRAAYQVGRRTSAAPARLLFEALSACIQGHSSRLLRAMSLRRPSQSRWLRGKLASSLLNPDMRQLLLTQMNESYLPATKSMHELLSSWIVCSPLPTLLRYEDRNSMAMSIEARVPFLDFRLVEFMFRRAYSLRIRDGWTKWIHRKAVEGHVRT